MSGWWEVKDAAGGDLVLLKRAEETKGGTGGGRKVTWR